MTLATGGRPRAWRFLVDTTGPGLILPGATTSWPLDGTTKWVSIRNKGGNILRLFFSAADFTADTNYVELAATTGAYDQPDEVREVWMKAAAASTTVELKVNYRTA